MQTILKPTPRCNICASNENTAAYDAQMKLYSCARCEHTFTLLDAKYHEKDIYGEDYFDAEHSNWFKYPNYQLFEFIRRNIRQFLKNPGFKLLDVGSGRGDLLSYLHKKEPQAELYGIDGAACKPQGFEFIQADFMKTTLHEKFDVVTSLACIEHVEDPDLFVRKIRDLTAAQGMVVIMTINSGGMMYGLARFLNKIGLSQAYKRLYSEHHIHHFNNKSLRLILEKHGFKILLQKNHNYNLASVDYPPSGKILTLLYKTLTAIIFALSDVFQNGISQTVICVPGALNP